LLAPVCAHARPGNLEQRVLGADPHVPVRVGGDSANVAVAQPRLVVCDELTCGECQHADARADPQTSTGIDVQPCDDAGAQLRSIAAIENGEAHAVEAHQTLMARQPQVAIGCAGQGFDRVLRQALLDLPVVEHVLADGQLRVERLCRPRQCDQHTGRGQQPHGCPSCATCIYAK
jgi:hypothetical protein